MRPHKASAPRLLVTHRETALILERAKVHVDGGRVVYHAADDDLVRRFNIPHSNLAILFLGQGCSLTQEAARLLAEESVYVAFTGTGGSPLHMGSLTTYQGTAHFRRMLTAYLDPQLSLEAARQIMMARFTMMETVGADGFETLCGLRRIDPILNLCKTARRTVSAASDIPSLLGHEGDYARGIYRVAAQAVGLSGFNRTPGADGGNVSAAADLVNSLIDHGNYLAYGIAGAALWALGIPPHLPVFHGKTRPGGLVFDLADSFKDAVVLPLAFAAGTGRLGPDSESVFRARMIDAIEKHGLLANCIKTVENMLPAERAGS